MSANENSTQEPKGAAVKSGSDRPARMLTDDEMIRLREFAQEIVAQSGVRTLPNNVDD